MTALTDALEAIAARGYQNGATGAQCARLSDAAAEDIPRLLAALRELLGIHRPDHHRQPLCAGCMDVWPCQDYSIMRRHLLNGGDER